MNNGWVKLHTKFLNSAIWQSQDSHLIQLFTYCLLNANWKDKEAVIGNDVVIVKRGQFITGRKSLVRALTTLKNEKSKVFQKMETLYRRKLEILEKLKFLTIASTNKYTVVTVQKYNEYQVNDQQVTNGRPTDDQQMTTTKEYKNKRIKEEKYPLSYLTEFPIDDFSDIEASEKQIRLEGEKALNWLRANNRKKTDHKAFLRNWVLKVYKKRLGITPAVEYEIDENGLARLRELKKPLKGIN